MTLEPARWKFYRWSHETWEAMLRAIEAAEVSIDFEQYYLVDLDDGQIGRRFVDAIERKARAGVRVRMLLDATGSWDFYTSPVPERLREAGIGVRFHRTISRKDAGFFFQSFLRDHRRLLVVDGRIGMVGGTAIKEGARDWRDTHAELEGPVVQSLSDAFDTLWESVVATNRYRITRPASTPDKFIVLPNGIRFRQRYVYRFLLDAIRDAKKCIYITTPYFSPDRAVYRSLWLAAKRGVDVRILLPEYSDSKFAKLVAESFYDSAFRAGVKIYEYSPSFLHAKTIIVDDDWASVGSCNFDLLSFFFNYELNVVSYDNKFVVELKRHFFDDLQSSMEITEKEWGKRLPHRRILEKLSIVARLFV